MNTQKPEPVKLRINDGEHEIYSTARKMFVKTSREAFEALAKYPDVIVEGQKPAEPLRYFCYKDGETFNRMVKSDFDGKGGNISAVGKSIDEIAGIIEKRADGRPFEFDRLSWHEPKFL